MADLATPGREAPDILALYDAVHGSIDLHDPLEPAVDGSTIVRLLMSPPLQRLRRIKQIDFAYHSYPSADHSRYAHALGTMHVMRLLIAQCQKSPGFVENISTGVEAAFPDAMAGDAGFVAVARHLLIAALLQDVGELPCGQTTKHVFRPSDETRKNVEAESGLNTVDWSPKMVFTVASLHLLAAKNWLDGYDVGFLTYLITGRSPATPDKLEATSPLLHMLNGAIDADRLDYVFRDAHHTIGSLGTPHAVIGTIIEYDALGPIVSDPTPATSFFATRAVLYSSVYHSPANRLRVHLLLALLRGALVKERPRSALYEILRGPELTIEDFLELDDVSLTAGITHLSRDKRATRQLSPRAQSALALLVDSYPQYEYAWLPPTEVKGDAPKKFEAPPTLFYDTFLDQRHRSLYDPGSVRVQSDALRYMDQPLPLEDCSGLLSVVPTGRDSMLPMHDSILLFLPRREEAGELWKKYRTLRESGWLYNQLVAHDPLGPFDVPADTRRQPGYTGKNMFISYAWQDVEIVKMLLRELERRRRHYYLLLPGYVGLGDTAANNSERAVKEADAVLIVASTQYVSRYTSAPGGNIAREWRTIRDRRVRGDVVPVAVVSVDDYRQIDTLPWDNLDFTGVPYVGEPLRWAGPDEINAAVDAALEAVDR